MALVVEFKLAERSQLTNLTTRLIEGESAIEGLELAGQTEHCTSQFELIETAGLR